MTFIKQPNLKIMWVKPINSSVHDSNTFQLSYNLNSSPYFFQALRYLKAKSAKESNRAEKLAISTGKSSSAEEEELDDSNSAELEETGSNSKSNSNSEDTETTGSSAELEETEDRFLRRRVLNSKSSRRSRHHHHR